MIPQVDQSHYDFGHYMSKERWISTWHQLDEVRKLAPSNILEIGPGPGMFKQIANRIGLHVETLDIDPELQPDHVGSVLAMPFPDNAYDVVCAFQILEHLPYEDALRAFAEIARCKKEHIVISLPDAQPTWRYRIHIPKLGGRQLMIPKPFYRAQEHAFDGQHYWEINKAGYLLQRIVTDFSKHARLIKTYRVFENPYHRFFVFAK